MAQFQMECLESKTKSVRNLYGRYKLEPLLPGQGYTLGNALRRTLLSNIECVAISGVRIAGIQHEYSTCLLYTSPSPRDLSTSRMPSSA